MRTRLGVEAVTHGSARTCLETHACGGLLWMGLGTVLYAVTHVAESQPAGDCRADRTTIYERTGRDLEHWEVYIGRKGDRHLCGANR